MTNDYESIKSADVILVIGSNTTETHPVIGSMIKEQTRKGARLIVCDPRKIELHGLADIPIRQKSGSDTALINSMMNVIIEEKLYDEKFVTEKVEKFDELKACTAKYTPEYAEGITGVGADLIREAARTYASGPNSALYYTMGITQHTSGTNNVRSLCNLALLCNMAGRPGTGVNPLRGQGNVQGACDMGCLPATLPGYLKVSAPEAAQKVKDVWGCELPKLAEPGLTVAAMVAAAGDGRIKALYVMGENPIITEADTNHAKHAFGKLDFLVVQDIFLTETAAMADVVLPAACWPEKDGTCTSTVRAVQRLRKAVNAPGEARADWTVFAELAKRFGHEWNFKNVEDVFEEIRLITPSYAGMTYKRLEEGFLHWPCPTEEHPGTPVLHTERFARPGGKASFAPCDWEPPHEWPDEEYPFIATTGRNLYHYHSGTMTRRSAPGKFIKELYIEINPKDAEEINAADGDMITVTSRRGSVTGKAKVTDAVREKMVFLPFHFSEAPANLLTASVLDPTSETPGYKVNAVRVEKSL